MLSQINFRRETAHTNTTGRFSLSHRSQQAASSMRAGGSIIMMAAVFAAVLLSTQGTVGAAVKGTNRRTLHSMSTRQDDDSKAQVAYSYENNYYEDEHPPAYNGDGYKKYEQYSSEDKYEKYGEDEDSGDYYYKSEHYDKETVKVFELVAKETTTPSVGVTRSIFRCSLASDDPEIYCFNPNSDYLQEEHEDPLHSRISSSWAAECSFTADESRRCPSFLTGACQAGVLNCTINKQSEKCGCPYHGGMVFVAKGYVVTVDGNICEPSANGREAIDEYYGEVNATLIPAAAQVFKGSFTGVVTGEGYKKVVGKIEFVQSVESHGPPERKAQASVSTVAKLADIEYLTHEELNLLKSGFMRVTLIEKEYY